LAAIVGAIIVGPVPLTGWLTAHLYQFATVALTGMSQAIRQILWYYSDGPAAHYGQNVLLWLKSAYSGRWSGRGGSLHGLCGRRM